MPARDLVVVSAVQAASYRLRPFCFACWGYFGAISDSTSFDPEVGLEGQFQAKGHGCLRCQGRIAMVWDHFGIVCWRNIGTISGTPSFDLEYDLANLKEGRFRVQLPKLDPVTKFGGNKNLSLNVSLNLRTCICIPSSLPISDTCPTFSATGWKRTENGSCRYWWNKKWFKWVRYETPEILCFVSQTMIWNAWNRCWS